MSEKTTDVNEFEQSERADQLTHETPIEELTPGDRSSTVVYEHF